MMLILTHENADFDAIASQLAAHKLYPEATPLLPRRINRNVSQFLTLYWGKLPFMRASEWRKKRVEELVLVDTQSISSVRGIVKRPLVRIIDHHTDHKSHDGWHYQVEAVGATVTLLVEMLRANGLILTLEEATLLLLGIYEDTGSLTYATTTSRDIRAAAWLVEQGGQLSVVRRFMNIPLTPAQRDLYTTLQANAEWVMIEEQSIVIATAHMAPDFDDEISSIAHRLRDGLSPAGLLVLVQINRDVQLVARSSSRKVDVSVIARELGGGGHSRAAAALVVGDELATVAQRVRDLLPRAVRPITTVGQLMSYGVRTLPFSTSVEEASHLMLRSGHEGYPVVDPESGAIVGLLTRRAVDRAMSHDLGRFRVDRVMKMGDFTVRPSDSMERVQQLMLDEGWGQIPVLAEEAADNSSPIGIVTRTDILNHLFKPAQATAEPDMAQLMIDSFPPAFWGLVLAVSETADRLNMPLYFVGGLARDLLLGVDSIDLDMVVEGDAILLVEQLHQQFGGEWRSHARFGTAKWLPTPAIWAELDRLGQDAALVGNTISPPFTELPTTIDFVTARTEFYTEPSALPEVSRGSIKLDLHRRDFSINTLAIRLDGAHLGRLLDFYGGLRDLNKKLLRVLHSLSFVDDPTRMLRAVRLEQRLGFQIEPRTAELITGALPMLDRVTGSRVRHEIEQGLREADPSRVMARLDDLAILAHIHPDLTWTTARALTYQRVPALLADPVWQTAVPDGSPTFLYFALWLVPLKPAVQDGVMARLMVRKTTADDMAAVNRALTALAELPNDPRPSQVEKALRPFPLRALLVVRVLRSDAKAAALLDQYVAEWRGVETAVTGHDLRQLDLKPGPIYAVILDKLRAARLDGEVTTDAAEQALLRVLVGDAMG